MAEVPCLSGMLRTGGGGDGAPGLAAPDALIKCTPEQLMLLDSSSLCPQSSIPAPEVCALTTSSHAEVCVRVCPFFFLEHKLNAAGCSLLLLSVPISRPSLPLLFWLGLWSPPESSWQRHSQLLGAPPSTWQPLLSQLSE